MNRIGPAGLAWLYLGTIVAATVAALIIVPVFDIQGSSNQTDGVLVVLVLAAISVADLLLARFVLLPQAVAHPDSNREQTTQLGFGLAQFSAMAGLIASVFTGQALLALPFGTFALVSWAIVRQFLKEAYPEDRRSRLREHRR